MDENSKADKALAAVMNDNDALQALDDRFAFFKTQITNEMKSFFKETLKSELAASRQEIQSLHSTVKVLQDAVAAKDQQLSTLQLKVDELEQYSRRNNVRIAGIQEDETEDVGKIVLDLINDQLGLDPPMEVREIDRVHRVGTINPDKHRPVLLKLATYRSRKRIMQLGPEAKKKCNKIYFNDDLTRLRSEMLWKLRTKKKAKLIEGCWTSEGRVLIMDNAKVIKEIKTMTEIDSI